MFVDVLKRYLLIVWNFFFGQGSTESIQEGPKDDQPAAAEPDHPVPSAAVDAKQDEVANEEDVDDDIEEIFDDEQEEGEEEEEEEEEGDEQEEEDDEVEEDESADEKADVAKKPEDKTVGSNDVPAAKPAGKAEDAAKKQPEAPKTSDVKPDEPKAAKDLPKVDVKPSKPEFEIVEREDAKPAPPAKDASKPEFVARESVAVVKPAAAKDMTPAATTTPTPTPTTTATTATKSNQDFEIVDREALKVAPEKDGAKEKADKDDDAAKPKDDAKKTVHVKFEDEVAGKGDGRDVKVAGAQKPQANAEFVVSEKGEDGGPKSAAGREAIDSFLLGEQRHSGGVHHHPESIQDQQLEYSDSGEELSDDDIEIDYEDDEDDEEVEEVKPLPPVARSVYKKND